MIVMALIVYCRSPSKQLYVSMTRIMHQNEFCNLLVYSCLIIIMAGFRGSFRGFVKGQHMYNTFYSKYILYSSVYRTYFVIYMLHHNNQTLKLGPFEFLEESNHTIV